MPRAPSIALSGARTRGYPVWRTAAIAPPRPRDLTPRHLSLPHGPWNPAELLLDLLQEGWGSGQGEDGPDTRKNLEVRFWVDCVQPPDDPDSMFDDPPTYTLWLTVTPVLFIKPLTVVLGTWTGSDDEAPGYPLWLRRLVDASGVNSPQTFVRLYTCLLVFVREVFATPNLTIPHVDSWIEIWELVEHIQGLYNFLPRRSGHPKPKPRPVRLTITSLVDGFEGMKLGDGEDERDGGTDIKPRPVWLAITSLVDGLECMRLGDREDEEDGGMHIN
ncbi:hypothetical protein OH76DRAFT_1490896 [Lentinus brumalis]|uniref:Uncharacterized protein n=1 Tax=Lentinus brumalis TaxID=2498619 RepID=A0A371CHD9_9APHY|nr:hypothetical protein OH76DRAFT_1490896 [Polyporus brumalis]